MAEKNVEDQFRDRLRNYEEDPGEAVWGLIESELPVDPPWYQSVWPALLLLLLLTIGAGTWIWISAERERMDTKELTVIDTLNLEGSREKQGNERIAFGNKKPSSQRSNNTSPLVKENADDNIRVDQPGELTFDDHHIRSEASGISESTQFAHKNNRWNRPGRSKVPRSLQKAIPGDDQPPDLTVGKYSPGNPVYRANDLKAHDDRPHKLDRLGWNFALKRPSLAPMTKVALDAAPVSEKKKEKPRIDWDKRRTAFYAQFMPTFTYNRIEANREDNQLIKAVKKIPAISVKRMGVRVEAGITHAVNARINIFAGALYFQRTQKINYYLQTVDSVETTNDGDAIVLTPGLGQDERSYEHQIQTLGIQVGAMYKLPGEKIASSIGSGAEIHRSLRKAASEIFEEPSLYVFYNLFYRLEYPTDKRFRFLAQPTFNYSLRLSEELSTPFYIKPYGFGLNFGFTYKF